MEMVSAAKMRKAVDAALKTRSYAQLAKNVLDHISVAEEERYPLLARREVKKMLIVLVSSNRGLCGSFNANVVKKAIKLVQEKQHVATHQEEGRKKMIPPQPEVDVEVLGIGKKSVQFAKKQQLPLVGVYDDMSETPTFERIVSISKQIIDGYTTGTYDKVLLVYTHFASSLQQITNIRQLLPVSRHDVDELLGELDHHDHRKKSDETVRDVSSIDEYVFEPDMDTVLNYIIPRLVDVQLYQGILESAASEHSARMVAMKSASDAAGDMIQSLQMAFNKARQAAITQEIAEIAGGAAALE